jgi:hypothetical protein
MQDGLGTEARRRRDRLLSLHSLEGAPALRHLPAAASCAKACQPLRVAPSWRSPAHGRRSLCALPPTRPPCHRRPCPGRRRNGGDRERLRRARTGLFRRARHRREKTHDRQRLRLRAQPLPTRHARRSRDQTPDEALPTAHQRQGRTLPSDNGARVGLRPRLSDTSTSQPSAATLARPLQSDEAPQLNQSPATDQPAGFTTSVGRTASERVFPVSASLRS